MRFFSLLSASLLLVCGLLRALVEVLGSASEGDADYLIYQSQLMLNGKGFLPWLQEFDDKLPVTYLFFIPSALFMSVRAYQLMVIAGLLFSAALLVQICREILITVWSGYTKNVMAIAMLAGGLYLYIQTVLPSSITTINVLSVIFFIISLWLLVLRVKWQKSWFVFPFVIAALIMAISISLRPYMLLPGILVTPWLFLREQKSIKGSLSGLFMVSVVWAALTAGWGFVINALPYVVTGNSKLFWAGILLLRQNIIPSNIPWYLQFQIKNIIELPNYAFLAFGSLLLLPLFFLLYGKLMARLKEQIGSYRKASLDVLFLSFIMPLGIQVLIMRKHYYPHYLQFFAPFAVLSFSMLLAYFHSYFPERGGYSFSWRRSGSFFTQAVLLAFLFVNLFLLRQDFLGIVVNLLKRPADSRMAEYVTFKRDKSLQPVLSSGFLYPESMFFHWRFQQHRFGFPNSASSELISSGSWADLDMPKALNLPKTKSEYCTKISDEKPPYIIVRSEWLKPCLDGKLSAMYKQLPQIDHRLIDLIQKENNLPLHRLSVYQLIQSRPEHRES